MPMPINLSPGGIRLRAPSRREQIVALGWRRGGEAGGGGKDGGTVRKRVKERERERKK